ncbi:UNVERIFIED_ORG: putative membrane protein YphA (DoxX/SURF4 family) [Paenarthrobacter nicotinovorans]
MSVSNYIDKVAETYRADPQLLSILRILFALHVLMFPVDYTWIARVPGAFFHPMPGPFMLITETPPLEFLVGLEILRATLALVLLLGFKTRAVSVVLTIVLVVGAGLTYSFGKVDHFILYETLPVAMGFAGWGSRYSIDSRRQLVQTQGFPMFLWAITVGFALWTAALPKVLTGWLDPSRHATRGYVARDQADPVKIGPLTDFVGSLDSTFLWKTLDYATVLAEGWVVLAVLVPPLFRCGILVIVGFHAGVFLALGIDFADYLLVYSAFFAFDPKTWFRPVLRRATKRRIGQPSIV